jgi:hypothetical protein
LENDSDADAYQGHGYTRVYIEEVGTFPSESPVAKLLATLRSGHGVPCQMKSTCNPGGPGHQWVKARYRLDTNPNGMEVYRFEFTNPLPRRRSENPSIHPVKSSGQQVFRGRLRRKSISGQVGKSCALIW